MATTALLLLAPVSAFAKDDPFLRAQNGTSSRGGGLSGTGQRDLGANSRVRRTPSTVKRSRAPRTTVATKSGRSCVRIAKTRGCTTFRKGKPSRVCVNKGKGSRCVRSRRARVRPLPRAVTNQGFLSRNIAQVGKIWLDGRPHCTGTLIRRGIIVTAAHCIYDNGLTGGNTGYHHESGTLEFTPNSTWNGATALTDDSNAAAVATLHAPNGVWRIVNAWVPQCWASNNGQCDIAYAQLQSANDGSYIGDRLGFWRLVTNLSVPIGARYFVVGYPASGRFATASLGYGDMQYFCDTNWRGEVFNAGALTGNANNIDSTNCVMTGGASGGPDFILLSNGTWAVNGVNSSGRYNRDTGLGENISWNYLGDVAAGLYCNVVGCASASSAQALSALTRPIPGAGPSSASRAAVRKP